MAQIYSPRLVEEGVVLLRRYAAAAAAANNAASASVMTTIAGSTSVAANDPAPATAAASDPAQLPTLRVSSPVDSHSSQQKADVALVQAYRAAATLLDNLALASSIGSASAHSPRSLAPNTVSGVQRPAAGTLPLVNPRPSRHGELSALSDIWHRFFRNL